MFGFEAVDGKRAKALSMAAVTAVLFGSGCELEGGAEQPTKVCPKVKTIDEGEKAAKWLNDHVRIKIVNLGKQPTAERGLLDAARVLLYDHERETYDEDTPPLRDFPMYENAAAPGQLIKDRRGEPFLIEIRRLEDGAAKASICYYGPNASEDAQYSLEK